MSHHNNQQSYYNFQQHTPGPPQPQWQAPSRKGWGDPRLGEVSSPVTSSPAIPFAPPQSWGSAPGQQPLPPPPPLPVGGFNNPPHLPNASQHNTAAWGVNYNQGQQFPQPQQDALRPPLPPRPLSAQGGAQAGWNTQSTQHKPPTPPPRPAEYAPSPQPQSQYLPHEQYSHRPTSHHYEPSTGQWHPQPQQPTTSVPTWQQTQHTHNGPVPPIDHSQQRWHSPTVGPQGSAQNYVLPPPPLAEPYHQSSIPAPGASALGSGGPSDWQHFPVDDQYYTEPTQDPDRRESSSFSITPEQMHPVPAQPSPKRHDSVYTAAPQAPAYGAQQRNSLLNTPTVSYTGPTQDPSQSKRLGSATSSSSSLPHRADTIDDVMNAWSSPASKPDTNVQSLRVSGRPTSVLGDAVPLPKVDKSTTETQTDFPPMIRTEIKYETKIETREIDPYEDLKNEYRTSLNRYVTMLRAERDSTNEQEKMRVVSDFVKREINLRSVMFNAPAAELVHSTELAELRTASERAKQQDIELNVLKGTAEKVKRQEDEIVDLRKLADRLSQLETENNELKHTADKAKQLENENVELKKALDKAKDEIGAANSRGISASAPKLLQLNTSTPSSHHSREDSFVVIDAYGDDAEYSPGGRPRMPAQPKTPAQQRPMSPSVKIRPPQTDSPAHRFKQPGSPSDNAPMTLDDYVMPDRPQTAFERAKTNATPANIQRPGSTGPPAPPKIGNNTTPINFQPARPAYTPFTYAASNPPPPMISNTNPADQAYQKLRHEQAAESGRLLSQEAPTFTVTAPDRAHSATPSRAKQQQEEAFIGLLRQQSKAVRRPATTPPLYSRDAPAPLRVGTPLKRRQSLPPLVKSAETLRESLPSQLMQLNSVKQSHPKLTPLEASITRIADDFSFIHATVVAWDKDNRKVRAQLEAERASRESDTQGRIDELFHDNQIGYADIAGLEEGFKVEEASKKYEEDQAELDSFTRNVFERVAERLEKEVSELETIRIRTLDVLDLGAQSASARVRTALKSPQEAMEKAPLSDTMVILLRIYDKIELRQTKIAEAHFERERRRKKLELSVLYTNGDTAGIKKLEKDFEKAQSMQVLSETRKRDERANKLMDSFDRAVVRGLSENQEWVDEIANKASLLRDLVLGSESNGPQGPDREGLLYGPGGVKETMDLLSDALAMVTTDSKDLVSMSTQADKILNEADFAMFLAEAKIANADDRGFDKLKSEKIKEDQKLKDEAEGRMNGVQRVPDEILGFVKDVRDYIGNDKDHQNRINQALEAAKKRNQGADQ